MNTLTNEIHFTMIKRGCPVCDSADEEMLYTSPDYKYLDVDGRVYHAPLRYVVCNDCTHIYKNPNPDNDQFSELYQHAMIDDVTQYNEKEQRSLRHLEAFKKLVGDYFENRPSVASVLEVGCGNGQMLRDICLQYKDKIVKAKGIEPSQQLGQILKNNNYFEFENIRLDQLGFSKKYDLIILDNVFEHFDFPLVELERLKKLLASNGLIYIAIPNILLPPSGFVDMFAGHPSNYTLENFNWLINRAGFDLIKFMNQEKWLTCIIQIKTNSQQPLSLDLSRAKEVIKKLVINQLNKNNIIREKIVSLLNREVSMLVQSGKKLLIFGAGDHSHELLSQIDFKGVIAGFIDRNHYYHGKRRLGYPVFSPEELNKLSFEKILLSSQAFENDMRNYLIENGVKIEKIISLYA